MGRVPLLFLICIAALVIFECSKLSPKGVEVRENGKCVQCHGDPPADSAHLKHSAVYACTACHPGTMADGDYEAPATHENGHIDVALDSGSYSAGDKTCQSTYCHGNFAGGTVSDVQWDRGPLACFSCHPIQPATNAHAAHRDYGCELCHRGYSLTSLSVNDAVHANGVVDVALDSGWYSAGDKTCHAAYCHGAGQTDTMGVAWNSGTVPWDDTLGCHGCHNTRDHMVTELGAGFTCWDCHQPDFHPEAVSPPGGGRP